MPRHALHLPLLLMLLCGSTGGGYADGKMFRVPTAVPLELRMPDQRALLWWSNGVERLVIETRFVGEGTNFAWVVPLPAAPKVEAATTGLFPTLTHLMRPQVIHRPTAWFLLALFLAGLLWLLLTLRPHTKMRVADWVAALAMGVGVGGIEADPIMIFGLFIFAAGAFGAYRTRVRGITPLEIVALVGLFAVFAGMLLPALATASAKGGSSSSVEILDRQFAGVFESTTLTAHDPTALRAWLTNHGYALPPAVEPVIADYLRDGWVFVASKVSLPASSGRTNSLHPLSFTFPAREPVYPLRLTGVDNGPLEVELFVFGPERAKADGFKVLECRPTFYPRWDSPDWHLPSSRLPMAHPGLAAAAPTAQQVTRLSGTLSPEQMRQDALIKWDGFAPSRTVYYSAQGALITGLNWTGSAACMFMVGVAAMARVRRREPDTYLRPAALAAIVATLATTVIYARLPVIPVKLEKRFAPRMDARNQFHAIRIALMDELPAGEPVTLESVRAAIQRGLPALFSEAEKRRFSYQIREEDSPYNYSLRAVPGGVEVLFHDAWGRPEVERYPP